MSQPGWCGAVLCGGASRRMGHDKALLTVAGRPMAQRVAAALVDAGAVSVVAIGGDQVALESLGLRFEPDGEERAGPLGGTITALRSSPGAVVAVVGCDLLDPSPPALVAVVEALLATPDAHVAVPLVDGHRQWVHAAWRVDAAAQLDACWDAGIRSLRRAGERLVVREVNGIAPAAVADADEPSDLTGREAHAR